MKKRRFTFWPWLLALLLGAGTWWDIDWWQAARPTLEWTYVRDQETIAFNKLQDDQASCFVEHPDPGIVWRELDRHGRYLAVELSKGDARHKSMEIVDLVSRKSIVSHANFPPALQFVSLGAIKQYCTTETDLYLIKETDGLAANQTISELWKWNLISNQAQLVQSLPVGATCIISQSGTALLVIEKRTIVLPSLLMPMSLATLLNLSVEHLYEANELLLMHVYSLPSMERRMTLAFPSTPGKVHAQLTPSGDFLVIPDVEPPSYGLSLTLTHEDDLFSKWFPFADHRLRVFDTKTGELWWEKRSLSQSYQECQAENDDLITFRTRTPGEQEPAEFLLHIPSRSVTNCLNYYTYAPVHLSDNKVQWIKQASDGTNEVIHTNARGEHAVAFKTTQQLKLIPNSRQCLTTRIANRQGTWPEWLIKLLSKSDYIAEYLSTAYDEMQVMDYEHKRTAWSNSSVNRLGAQCTEHWLITRQEQNNVITFQVYALPFPSWSPWWSLTAGLVVFLLTLYILRWRRLQRG